MKLAVSNIAWSYGERLRAYAILRSHGFTGLEVAPGLFFAEEPDPFVPSASAVTAARKELDHFGLELISMQSLLFGVEGAELFGPPKARERFAAGAARAIALAGRIGVDNLVLGSPRQRVIPPGVDAQAALATATETFRRLGDLAVTQGARFALETNAAAYGTNFMTTFPETIQVVHATDHPAVAFNFDVGALHMTGAFRRVAEFALEYRSQMAHVHISSAQLAPAPSSMSEARMVIHALRAIDYQRAISIEMKAVDDGLATLEDCVERLKAAACAGS